MALFWLLFRSLRLAAQVFFLLGISVVLAFAAMAGLGLPLTFLSLNLGLMVLVIGTADLVHIAGRFAALRRSYGPLGAALRASRDTASPVLLTSLTTAACLLVTSASPLYQVRQFAFSLAAGVMVTWAIAEVYGPQLIRRSALTPDRGGYFWIHRAAAAAPSWSAWRVLRHPGVPATFALVAAASLAVASTLRVDSNWFRFFGPDTPVGRTLAFLPGRGFPISGVECTLDAPGDFLATIDDGAVGRDLDRVAQVLAAAPGVQTVDHLGTQLAMVRRQLDAIEFPAEVPLAWRDHRRHELLRRYFAGGSFDAYYSAHGRRLRLVGRATLESSRELSQLKRRLEDEVQRLPLERLAPGSFVVTGQMHFWAAIVAEIPQTFLTTLGGCLVVVFAFFAALSGSLRLGALALVPNVLPLATMFAAGRLAGIPLNENVCFVVSLVIGIAVDDTLHLLYHFTRARTRGASPEAAVQDALVVAGAPILVTSLLLGAGFSVAWTSSLAPVWQIGLLLPVAIGTAVAADLLLLPAMLLRLPLGQAAGEARGYRVEGTPGPERRGPAPTSTGPRS